MLGKNSFLVLLFSLIILSILAVSSSIRGGLVNFGNMIKYSIFTTTGDVSAFIDSHIDQSNKILSMQKEIEQLKEKLVENEELQKSLKSIPLDVPYKNSNISRALAYSYASLANYNKIWLKAENKKLSSDKLYGLLKNDAVVGIAKVTKDGLLGLLNGNARTSYSVIIGIEKAPGIVVSNGENSIKVNFIPNWLEIKKGDEVVTSGLDGIFFEGIKVGVVESVEDAYGYKIAYVRPYVDNYGLGYLYLIDLKIDFSLDSSGVIVERGRM